MRVRIMVDPQSPIGTQSKRDHRQECAACPHVEHRLASVYHVLKPFQQHAGCCMMTGAERLLRVEDDFNLIRNGSPQTPSLA